MQHFSQNSILCVHPSAAAGLRQAFVNDRNGEILLYVTLPCIKETVRFQAGSRGWVLCNGSAREACRGSGILQRPSLTITVGVIKDVTRTDVLPNLLMVAPSTHTVDGAEARSEKRQA